MEARSHIGKCIAAVGLWILPSPLHSQSLPVPEVILPQEQQVHAWGRSAPAIRLEARIPPSERAAQYFVTVNITTPSGQLVRRVPLRDDGKYGDQTAGDGIFSGTYTAEERGEFQARARLTAQGVDGERWSEVVRFAVEQVPYVDITAPDPNAKTGTRVKVKAALLFGPEQQPYTPTQERVRVLCWTHPETKTTTTDVSTGDLSVPLEFPRPGRYRVMMSAQTFRQGQWIDSAPDSVWLNVVLPPRWPFLLAAGLFIATWLLPRKQTTVYRHIVEIRSSSGDLQRVQVTPKGLSPVSQTVGGEGCDTVLKGVSGKLFTLLSNPGDPNLYVQMGDGQPPKRLSPNEHVAAFTMRDKAVYYLRSKPEGKVGAPFWSLTGPRKVCLLLSLVACSYGIWAFWQFIQLTKM